MNIWQTQEAKAEFSRLIKHAQMQGDQIITHRGEPVAVVVSKKRYEELTQQASSFLDFFKNAPLPNIDLKINRSKDTTRTIQL